MVQYIIDALATTAAKIETFIHPDAVTLPGFPRSIFNWTIIPVVRNRFTVFCNIYNKQCTPESIEKQLHTDEDGTSVSDIKRVLKRYELAFRTLRKPGLRDLKAAIDDDCPVLISLYDGSHYALFMDIQTSHIFVSNPSLNILRLWQHTLRYY